MTSKVLILLMIFIVSSCGSHVVVRTTKCNQDIAWESHIMKPDFKIEDSVATPFGFWYPTQVDITKFLKREKIECSSIKSLSIVVRSTFTDIIRTVIPFLSTKSFIIVGKFKP